MKNKKSTVIRLIVCVAIVAILIVLGKFANFFTIDFSTINFNYENLLRVILMAAAVLAVETVLVIILSFIKPKSHRGQSIVSILSSLMKYIREKNISYKKYALEDELV